MFVALDNLGNRVYADSAEKGSVCFCPVCNEELRLRKGGKITNANIRRAISAGTSLQMRQKSFFMQKLIVGNVMNK